MNYLAPCSSCPRSEDSSLLTPLTLTTHQHSCWAPWNALGLSLSTEYWEAIFEGPCGPAYPRVTRTWPDSLVQSRGNGSETLCLKGQQGELSLKKQQGGGEYTEVQSSLSTGENGLYQKLKWLAHSPGKMIVSGVRILCRLGQRETSCIVPSEGEGKFLALCHATQLPVSGLWLTLKYLEKWLCCTGPQMGYFCTFFRSWRILQMGELSVLQMKASVAASGWSSAV